METRKNETLIFNLSISDLYMLIDEAVRNALNNLKCPKSCNETAQKEILNLEDTAKLTLLSKSTIYGLVSKRKIPFFKQGKILRFKRSELIAWIESGRKKTIAEIEEAADEQIIKNNERK